jgi:hypothetical protein
MAEPRDPREQVRPRLAAWRDFRRARHALWATLVLIAAVGAALHHVIAQSLFAQTAWLLGVFALIGYPLRYLLGFRCPRCGGVFLATGKLRDFLGLARILWANQCGSCSLRAGDGKEPPSFSDAVPSQKLHATGGAEQDIIGR